MPKLQPQITQFASISSTNEPGKLEFGRNCRKKLTFKITTNQNNKFNCYQLWQPATKLLLHQNCTKLNKNSTTRLLDIDMEGVAAFTPKSFHHELRNLENAQPTTTTFSMNGPDSGTELSVEKFQRQICFLEKNMEPILRKFFQIANKTSQAHEEISKLMNLQIWTTKKPN